MAFWQVFLLFSLLSAVFILWPFFRTLKKHKHGLRTGLRSDARDAILKDREAELQHAKEAGELNENEYAALKSDLSQTLHLQEAARPDDSEAAVTYGNKSKVTVIALAILIPLAVLIFYSKVGAKADWEITDTLIELAESESISVEKRRELQVQVMQRLKDTPENGSLWFLLANLSTQLGDFEEAVKAYRYLHSLYPDSPTIIAELAQALFLRAGNVVTPEVRKNTQLALSINAEIPMALGLAGIDAFQSQDYPTAIAYWKDAVQRLEPNSPASAALSEGIVRAQAALGASGGDTKTSKAQASEAEAEIKVKVSLSDNVQLEGTETLFVYARAWQGARIPLAVQRVPATQFPVLLTLDSSMAMAEGMDITSAAQLELVARISKSGNAVPQSGDWSGSYGPIILGEVDKAVDVVIAEQMP